MEQKGTVLIAEDDESIAEVISVILRDAGYLVKCPESYSILSQVVLNEMFNLVLIDGWLWGEKGADICKQIKSTEKTKKTPVVLLSAQTNAKELAIEMGADDVLEKPFDIDELLKIVSRYCVR